LVPLVCEDEKKLEDLLASKKENE